MPHQNPLSSSDGFLLKVCLLAVALVILSATLNVPGAFEQTDMALAQNEQVTFTNVTISAGVNNSTTPQWGGVWGDYNGDGYQDLYAGNHFDTPHLYLNNSDGTFTDVQPQDVGIKSGPDDWHSAAWGDYNNDGHLDLYVVVGKAQDGSDFYINNGDGTFTENALAAGVKNQDGRGRTPQWVDYDNDGDLDIFISNHTDIEAPHVLYRNNNDGTFTDVADQAGVALSLGAEGVAWADYDNDGWMDFILSKTGDSSTRGYNLFHNQKDGTFNDVSNDVGLSFAGQYPQTAAWGDYDNDGDLDLFLGRSYFPFKDNLISTTDVITVFAQVSQGQEGLTFNTSSSDATFDLWRIDQILKTNEIELGAGNTFPTTVPFTLDNTTNIHIGQPAYTPGEGDEERVFVWRDTQGDPWNIYWNSPTSSFRSFYTVSIIKTDGTFTDVISDGLDIPTGPASRPNALYRNKGDGTFEEVTTFFDAYKYNTYNAQWVDFDNDSDLDLYVTNAGDTYVGNQPNQLYQNNGDGTFTDVADSVGLSDLTSNNENCSAWADYNNDGFLDMFLANSEFTGPLAGLHKLYRNEGNDNHWLQITLTGTVSNRLGIGARIEVTTEDLTQFRQMGAEASNPCRNGFVAHFGLGQITTVDTITVTWPSGNVDVLEDVSADQILNITEDINSPTLTMTTPSDEATNVFLNQPIIVDFSEPMNTNSVNYIVTPTVSLTATWNKDDTQLTLTHNNFASNTTYTVEVTGQDKAGNSLIFNSVPNPWQFTTGTQTSPETDLSITQARIGTGSVTAGDSITYTLSITNGGPTAPVDATVVMSFNDATALSVVNGSNCSWPSNSKDVTCTISDVGSTLATLTLGVDTSLTYNGNLTSWVTIEPTGGVIDPNPENNDDGPLAVTVVGDGLNNAYLPTIVK